MYSQLTLILFRRLDLEKKNMITFFMRLIMYSGILSIVTLTSIDVN
jgi:hypothetical protein